MRENFVFFPPVAAFRIMILIIFAKLNINL